MNDDVCNIIVVDVGVEWFSHVRSHDVTPASQSRLYSTTYTHDIVTSQESTA